jgi:hypothetical protein
MKCLPIKKQKSFKKPDLASGYAPYVLVERTYSITLLLPEGRVFFKNEGWFMNLKRQTADVKDQTPMPGQLPDCISSGFQLSARLVVCGL